MKPSRTRSFAPAARMPPKAVVVPASTIVFVKSRLVQEFIKFESHGLINCRIRKGQRHSIRTTNRRRRTHRLMVHRFVRKCSSSSKRIEPGLSSEQTRLKASSVSLGRVGIDQFHLRITRRLKAGERDLGVGDNHILIRSTMVKSHRRVGTPAVHVILLQRKAIETEAKATAIPRCGRTLIISNEAGLCSVTRISRTYAYFHLLR